jgi:hypothetical protein
MAEVTPPERIPESQAKRYRFESSNTSEAHRKRKSCNPAEPEKKELPFLHDQVTPDIDPVWAEAARQFAEQSVREVKERVWRYHGLKA